LRNILTKEEEEDLTLSDNTRTYKFET